jgi:serine/threonine-protein kinase
MAEAELKTLGRYNIERTLGKGAMGVVYEGLDPKLNRRVAIKTILKSHLDPDTAKDYSMRFSREAQAVARLNHPHIVQVYDFAEEGDIAYLVMEFIRGKELKNFFDANERFDIREAVRVMCELLDALEFAHNAGIIHRDIKPANVMLDSQARTKLTDFGVARVQDSDRTQAERTQAGTMVGTPAYMSPEQITGANIDKRTDLFSAGIILYQFLTGEKPFTGGGAWTIAKKIIQEDPPAPSSLNNAVTPFFDAVVNKALSKNPDTRYQSAKDFGVALRRALEGKGDEDDSDKTVVGEMSIPPAARTAPPPRPAAAVGSTGTQTGTQAGNQEVELEFWRAIKDGNDPDDFDLYVQQFPTGIYAALAKRKISKLRGAASEETTAEARKQEKKEAEEAARKETEARAKLADEKEKLELELAKKEEEFQKREAQREAEAQARAEAAEKAKQEAAAERERARLEAEKARQEAAAELAMREAEYKKREVEAEAKRQAEAKARAEAEAKAKADADAKAKQELAAERERARLEAEQAKQEAEKARREAEEKAKKETEAFAKKQAEERAKREAEFKKREAELKAQAAAGGKKTHPAVLVGIPAVIIAIAGAGWYFFAPDDAAQKQRIAEMQKQLEAAKQQAAELEKAKKREQEAQIALEKAKKDAEEARKSGDKAKEKQLAEELARRETEQKKMAEATKAREAEAKKSADAAEKMKQEQQKLADARKQVDSAKQREQEAKQREAELAKQREAEAKRQAEAKQREAELARQREELEKQKREAEQLAKQREELEKQRQALRKEQEELKRKGAPAAPAGGEALYQQGEALEQEGKGRDAVKVYVRAARSGNGKAAKRLGEIYDKGIAGVSRDYAESLKWYNAARVLGEDVPMAKSR